MQLTRALLFLKIASASLMILLAARPFGAQAQRAPVSNSHGDPSDLEQYMLELINRARIDPTAEGIFLDTLNTRYSTSARARKPEFFRNLRAEFASYPAAQPLAFNQSLIRAARGYAEDMTTRGYIGHVTPEGLTPSDRAAKEGYSSKFVGENFAGGGALNQDEVLENHFGLMVDYDNLSNATHPLGHRLNVLDSTYSEIGVGIFGSLSNGKIVQDFGDNDSRFLLGVVYQDRNGNQFYDPGEGVPGVTITLSGGHFFAVTSGSGGFAIPMEPAEVRNLTEPVRTTVPAQPGWNDEIQRQDDAFRSNYAASNIVPTTLTVTASGGSLQNSVRKEISIPALIQVNYRLYGTDNWFFTRTMFVGQNAKVDFKVGSPLTLQITSQPVSQVVSAGSTVTFYVAASGQPPLRYQWRKNGVNIAGATNATYTIAAVTTASAGGYTVVVSNSAGSVTSQTATLTINVPAAAPTITTQPQSLTRTAGQTASFTVAASGTTPLSFQWRKNAVNLANGGRISGVNTATLTIASVQTTDSGSYTVIVSNSSRAVTSSSAQLTVEPLPALRLSARVNGKEIILSWSDPAATLEEAYSVTGPWELVLGASPSPRSMAISASRKFFRLRMADGRPTSGVIPVPNMVWIPAGTFTMGSPATEKDHFGPATAVTVTKGIWIGKYEVTQREYLAVMGSNPSAFTADLDRPVEIVSWHDAVQYCDKLTQREQAAGRLAAGYVYRLPTEAEWEYACRAGTTTTFSYGDDPGYGELGQYAWYWENSWTSTRPSGYFLFSGEKYYTSKPVGTKQPNVWGLYDMHGNVWEWCLDWWEWSLPGGSVTDPKGRTSGMYRVYRGGSWLEDGWSCRSVSRIYAAPDFRYFNLGFRCALGPSQ